MTDKVTLNRGTSHADHYSDVMGTAYLTGRLWARGIETNETARNVISNLTREGRVCDWCSRDIAEISMQFGEGIRSVSGEPEITFGE